MMSSRFPRFFSSGTRILSLNLDTTLVLILLPYTSRTD
ncbi:hypothetical protein LEP1GSC105_2934 [Leptospira interrogans str. UI 12758]|uniref:Uncharacterized protein n=1 Tax=Leptospira interrogans str. UI 12758 TaxID=1049938 RepID=A0A0E2D365_LEPIR|nr:hypothetical protein LEP1GSC105_2934 [Leptospira interrogans str. UI 12758]